MGFLLKYCGLTSCLFLRAEEAELKATRSMSDNTSSFTFDCYSSSASYIVTTFFVTKTFIILPISIIVLYLGYQRWQRQQRSFAAMSHSDIFTYNVTIVELIFVLGATLVIFGWWSNNFVAVFMGMSAITISYPGEMFFNTVTCVERYLAVVHPITYLGLKQSGGVRIRNICIGFVWLLCFGCVGLAVSYYPNVPYIPCFCMILVSLVIVSFCSFSVLCVLVRPGPGEMGGDRQQMNRSKQKAFHTITAIMAALLMSCLGTLFTVALGTTNLLSDIDRCAILMFASWFSLPVSLILPLLFLHRAGKLSFCLFSNK